MLHRSKATTYVVAASLLIAFAAFALLIADFRHQEVQSRLNPAGKVIRITGNSKYKAFGSYLWIEVTKNQDVFPRDIITAGPSSQLTIQMENGQTIELAPGASIVIDDILELSKSKAQGQISIVDSEGNETQFFEGSSTESFLPTKMMSPGDQTEFFALKNETVSVKLAWQLKPIEDLNSSLHLQISQNRFFDDDLQELAIPTDKSGSLNVSLPAGVYYWRLFETQKGRASVYRQLNILSVSALHPQKPSGETSVWNKTLEFAWSTDNTETADFGTHWLEVSTDAEFKNLVIKRIISPLSNRVQVEDLQEGKSYWRLRSVYAQIELLSEVKTMDLKSSLEIQLSAVSPSENKVISMNQPLAFRWKCNKPRANFILEIENPEGTKITNLKTQAESYIASNLLPGSYRWKVVVEGQESLSQQSVWHHFFVLKPQDLALLQPQKSSRVEIDSPDSLIAFKWAQQARSSFYVFQISAEPDFQNPIAEIKTFHTEISSEHFKLLPGQNYFWRVINFEKDAAKQMSFTSTFFLTVATILPPPENLLPLSGVICNPTQTKGSCLFSWESVKGAEGYDFSIYKKSSDLKTSPSLILNIETKENVYKLKNFAEGDYFWTVRAIDKKRRRGQPSLQRSFQYTLGKPLSAPRNLSSEVQ